MRQVSQNSHTAIFKSRTALALKEKSILEAEAKERQREHGGTAPGKPKTLSQNSDGVNGRTDEQIARKAEVSRDTVRKVEVSGRREEGRTDQAEPASGEYSVDRAHKIATGKEDWRDTTKPASVYPRMNATLTLRHTFD